MIFSKKEVAQINTLKIDVKAKKLYGKKRRFPNEAVSLRCVDFCALEKLAQEYITPTQVNKDVITREPV